MAELTLSQTTTIMDATLKKGRELQLQPLTVAVLDAGGNLKGLNREDGSGGALRPEVAYGKAFGAVGMGRSSRSLETMAIERPTFVSALAAAAGGRLIPAPGGVLIRDSDGRLLGAVGVSGDTSDNDETCAIAGVEAAGLYPEV